MQDSIIVASLLGLIVTSGFYIILKKSTPRKRKIISMTTAGVVLIIFLIHTVFLVVATKNYEKSLITIKDIGLPVTLEEIIMNDPDRKLLPEENAVELLKPYRDIGWWQDEMWPNVPQKKLENEIFGNSVDASAFDNLIKADYDLSKLNSATIYKLKAYISVLVNNKEDLKAFYEFSYKEDYIFTAKESSILKNYLPRHAYNKEALLENNKFHAYLTVHNSSLDKMSEKEIALLKSYISKQKGTIDLIDKMSKCKGFYMEMDKKNPITTQHQDMLKTRETFEMLCLNIALKERENRLEEAIAGIKKYYYVNRIMNFRQTGVLLSTMIGTAISGRILQVAEDIAENKNITEKQCTELIELLEENVKEESKAYTCALNNERAGMSIFFDPEYVKSGTAVRNTLDSSLGNKAIVITYYSYLFKPLRIMEKTLYNEAMSSEIKDSKQEYLIENYRKVKIPWYGLLTSVIIADLRETTKSVFIVCNDKKIFETKLLIKKYKFKTGKLPASLTDIKKVTGYDVPRDVMTGKEFKYELNGDKYTLKSEYKEKNKKRKISESVTYTVPN
jgi:hypothetical protein